jgi:hypothetical protein
MVPSQFLVNRIQALLATDTTTLAPAASACKVHLAMAAFVPSAALLIGGLTEATFTGYAALLAGTGTQQSFNDVASGGRVVQLLEPAGGWHWQTTGTTGLPMTIYGWYVTDNGTTTLYGSALFATPVLLTLTGDSVDIPQVRILIPPGVFS